MKKIVLLWLLVMTLLLSACNAQGIQEAASNTNVTSEIVEPATTELQDVQYFDEFSALLVGGIFESACGISFDGDIVLTSSSQKDEQVPKEYIMEKNGENVKFTYVETRTDYLYREAYHVFENREIHCKIWINIYTNEITFFTSYAPNPVNPDHPEYTEQELFDIAYAFLCENVSDPENYQVTRKELFVEEGLSDELMVEFSRTIGGIATSDSILLYISNGQIGLFKMLNLGQMENVRPLSSEQLSKIEQAVLSKVEILYQNRASKYEFVHVETSYKILYMSDGRMAIRCYPTVRVTDSETETVVEEELDMLIYLN